MIYNHSYNAIKNTLSEDFLKIFRLGVANDQHGVYIGCKNEILKDMNTPEMIKKVDFAEYEGKYDESVNDELTTSPEDLPVETMREYLYGYTFTEIMQRGSSLMR